MVVELDTNRFNKAKQTAAQRLSKRLNIPGFRKGKAPYRIVANYVGEPAIIEDAVELLADEVYKTALDETALDPYGPGSLDDYQVEPVPTLTFSVPLRPTVDLKDYRAVRIDWEAPEVTDEQVEQTLKAMQLEHAVIETSSRPAAMGDRVTIDVHSVIELEDDDDDDDDDEDEDERENETEASVSDEAEAAAADDEDDDADDEEDDDDEDEDDDEVEFIHAHDQQFMLDPENEPVPGFSAAIVGMQAGETREFELRLPDDHADYPGAEVEFEVTVSAIENVTLPTLNDELAARATADEENPLSLLELRMRIRENLGKQLEAQKRDQYVDQMLDAVLAQAEVRYPEAAVAHQIDHLLQRFDQNLRRNQFTLRDYMQIYRKSVDDLYQDYRPQAVRTIERSLVLTELLRLEQIEIGEAEIEAEIDKVLERVGAQDQDQARALFAQGTMRDSIRDELSMSRLMDRLVAIGRGEAPDLPPPAAEAPAESDEAAQADVSESPSSTSEEQP